MTRSRRQRMYLYLNNPVKHKKIKNSGKKWVPHTYIRIYLAWGPSIAILSGFRAFLGVFGPKIRLKSFQKMILNLQQHFGGCFGHFQGVFGSILGHFLVKIQVFPISTNHFLDRIRSILDISGPKIRLKKFQKMFLSHQKNFGRVFWSLIG